MAGFDSISDRIIERANERELEAVEGCRTPGSSSTMQRGCVVGGLYTPCVGVNMISRKVQDDRIQNVVVKDTIAAEAAGDASPRKVANIHPGKLGSIWMSTLRAIV